MKSQKCSKNVYLLGILLASDLAAIALAPNLATANTANESTDKAPNPATTGQKTTKATGLPKTEIQSISKPSLMTQAPESAKSVVATADQVKILAPTPNTVLDTSAATIVVQYPIGSQLDLRVGDVPVDDKLIGRTEQNDRAGLITQTWYGVALKEGTNIIKANVISNGKTMATASTMVQTRGAIARIQIEPSATRVPADGKTLVTIQGQLLDAQNNRSNRDGMITLASNGGEWVTKDASPDQPGFQVKAENGRFNAELKAGLEAKTVNVKAQTLELEAFTQVLFETNLRPSIATGVINVRLGRRGTDFFGSLKDFVPPDGNNGWQLDANAAVFATGKIGDWLFTGAYNSDRPLNKTCEGTVRLFRQDQFCENQYPVYGDSSKSDILAPSIDNVYLRLERTSKTPGAGIDYAMWGDYNTEEFATKSQEFTSFTRQLHGFKANYNFGDLQISGLYANNVEGFQRDTIAPDGTSGYYFLSRRLVTEGSEDIFIEMEELNRPGTVLERRKLTRGPDYEIDYDRGTVLFREPVLRTDVASDGTPLVRRIVATYQYDEPGSNNKIYGARARYHLSREQNRESWIGATYWKEDRSARDFELYGADAFISLGSKGSLIAEYAHSKNTSNELGQVSGNAYRIEAQGELAKGIQGRAYYRSADSGFANNATVSFVPGQTRYGAQVTAKVSETTNLKVQYDRETNKGIAAQPLITEFDLFTPREAPVPGSRVDNSLTSITAGIQQRFGSADLTVDWIHRDRSDRINPSANTVSDQLRSRFTMPIAKNLTFLAQNEMTLSSQNDAYYPDRTLLGLNWQVMKGVNMQLAQQFFTSGQYAGKSITSLSLAGDYKLFPETTISGRAGIYSDAGSWTTSGAIGIKQGIRFSPGLRMDLAYEHVFGSFIGQSATGTQFIQPFAPGQSAASLGVQGGDSFSVGLEYNDSPNFQASARVDHRTSSSGTNTVISAGATGKLSPSLTALVRYQQASSANQGISGLGTTSNLKMGLAYRDLASDKFNALFRYEYRHNPSTIPDSLLFSSGTGSEEHLFGLEAIYAPAWNWEFYGKFALRNSKTFLADDFTAKTTTSLAQLRATYRLNYSWDLSGEARWISQPTTGYSETGFALEAGYYLTPNLRLSAGYAFGSANDRDFDGYRSAGGPYVGLTVKVNELFNGFGLQKAPKPKNTGEAVADNKSTQPTPAQSIAAQATPAQATAAQPATTTEAKLLDTQPAQAKQTVDKQADAKKAATQSKIKSRSISRPETLK